MGILLCPCTRLFARVTRWQMMLACSDTAVNSARPFSVTRCRRRKQSSFQDWTSFKNSPQTGWNHSNSFIISRLLSHKRNSDSNVAFKTWKRNQFDAQSDNWVIPVILHYYIITLSEGPKWSRIILLNDQWYKLKLHLLSSQYADCLNTESRAIYFEL